MMAEGLGSERSRGGGADKQRSGELFFSFFEFFRNKKNVIHKKSFKAKKKRLFFLFGAIFFITLATAGGHTSGAHYSLSETHGGVSIPSRITYWAAGPGAGSAAMRFLAAAIFLSSTFT